MTQVDAVDFVVAPPPDELHGIRPLPYTGNARPSQEWVDACTALGVPPLWYTQETTSTRSQEGWQAGVYDCLFAERRARERGHTGPIAVVVSDGNYADEWDASGYGAGWASVATMPFFPYGALGVTATFLAGAAGSPFLIVGEWVPETWGAGRVASQLVGAQAPISTPHDLNHVFHDFAPTTQGDPEVIYQVADAATDPKDGYTSPPGEYWRLAGLAWIHGTPSTNENVVPITGGDFLTIRRQMLDVVAAAETTLGGVSVVEVPLDIKTISTHDLATELAGRV